MFAILFLLINSCHTVDSVPAKSFSIQTDSSSYSVSDKLSAKVVMINNLGEEVTVYNNGCGFPGFSLEGLHNGQWVDIGPPLCVATPVPPTLLANGNKVEAVVNMNLISIITSGYYRMHFSIWTSRSNQFIDSKYLVSNSFQIQRQ